MRSLYYLDVRDSSLWQTWISRIPMNSPATIEIGGISAECGDNHAYIDVSLENPPDPGDALARDI